jgi:Na+/H+-dicarboxylate symporter
VKPHTRLFIALVLGAIIGALLHPYADTPWVAGAAANVLRPIGQLFLRSIFMIVVPMVFSALVIGVYELRQGPGLPGVAARTLIFTAFLSAMSVLPSSSFGPTPRRRALSPTRSSSSCREIRSKPRCARSTARCWR